MMYLMLAVAALAAAVAAFLIVIIMCEAAAQAFGHRRSADWLGGLFVLAIISLLACIALVFQAGTMS